MSNLDTIKEYLENIVTSDHRPLALSAFDKKKVDLFKTSLSLQSMGGPYSEVLIHNFNASTDKSHAYNSLFIKRIESISSNFVYNFFEIDEKRKNANEETSSLNVIDNNLTEDQIYSQLIKNSKKSRYVDLTINMPIFSDEELVSFNDILSLDAFSLADQNDPDYQEFLNVLLASNDSNDYNFIDYLMDYVVYEGNLSNQKTTGIEYFDTYADKNAYRIFSSSINFSNLTELEDSLTSSSKKFINKLEENNGKFSLDQKKNLLSVLADLNSAYSGPKDNFYTVAENYSNVYFSTKYNNLFIGDIINTSTVTLNHIYADEQLGLIEKTGTTVNDIQTNAINTSSPMQHLNGELNLFVTPLPGSLRMVTQDYLEDNEISSADIEELVKDLEENPDIKICGVLMTVYEISQGKYYLHDRRIIKNIKNFSGNVLYEKIKYGKSYLFEFRTITIVDTIFDIEGETDDYLSFALGSFLVLTDKVSTYVNCVENIPPPAPNVLKVDIDQSSIKPELTWNFPVNPQRDIKKFYIFKRLSLNEPYILQQVNNFNNSLDPSPPAFSAPSSIIFNYNNSALWPNKFIDYDFDMKSQASAIYAIISEDAHGMTSGYSTQILIKYDKINNRFLSEKISRSGAPQPYPNIFLEQDFFNDAIKVSNYTRCNVFFDPEYYKLFKTDSDNPADDIEIDYITFTGENQIEDLLTKFPYQFHFINIDQQLDQLFEINIANKSGIPDGIPAVEVNSNYTFNLNL